MLIMQLTIAVNNSFMFGREDIMFWFYIMISYVPSDPFVFLHDLHLDPQN